MNRVTIVDDTIEFKGLRLIGGQSGLNFLNTVKYRGKTEDGDRFTEFLDIIKWARLVEVIDEPEYKLLSSKKNCPESTAIYREICNFREQTRIIFDLQKNNSGQFEKALKYVEDAISQLRPAITISRKTGILKKSFPIKQPIDLQFRIVACVDDLLQHRASLIIKACSGLDCDWLFSDETKAKRRKWCDTRTCGNLARVRRHRENV